MEGQNLFPDQRDVLVAFLGDEVRFLLVGGWAFAAHAFIRTTKDIDLWIDPTAENAARAWRALAKYGAPLHTHRLTIEDLQRPDIVYQMGEEPARIDVLTGVGGLSFSDAWERRIEAELDGLLVPVIGLDDLIAAKEAAGRRSDRRDLRSLKRVRDRRKKP